MHDKGDLRNSEHDLQVLVRNPNPEVLECNEAGIAIFIEVESIDDARYFCASDKYTAAKAVHEPTVDIELILVERM